MATKPGRRPAADKWDAANMAYQTVKVRKTLLDSFKAACAARGDKVNTVLRQAMERYVADHADGGGADDEHADGEGAAKEQWGGVWNQLWDADKDVYGYLHANRAYAESLAGDFASIKQALEEGIEEGHQKAWGLVDKLIAKVKTHMNET